MTEYAHIGLTNSTRYLIIWIILDAVDIVGNKVMLNNKPQIVANSTDYHGFFICVRITSYNVCYTKLLRLKYEIKNNKVHISEDS